MLKIAIKPRDGNGKNLSILAFWERDDRPGLNGALDSRITQLAVQLEDGTIIRVKRDADGKTTHFVNAFDERNRAPRQNHRSANRSLEPEGEWDSNDSGFGDDELPF